MWNASSWPIFSFPCHLEQSGYDHYGDDDYAPMEMDDDDDDEPPKLNDDDQDQAPPPPQDDDDDDDNNGYHQLPPSPSGEPFIDKDSGFLSPNMSLNMSKDAASLNSKSQKRKSKKVSTIMDVSVVG